MQTISVSSTIAAPAESVRETILDIEPFVRAAGFDEVAVDGERIHVANSVGIADIELELEVVEASDAVLAYEQREGIFEEMRTEYRVTPTDRAVEVAATTSFALDVAVVGGVLDATVIKRQRRRELRAQFEHIEDTVAGPATSYTVGQGN